LTFFIGCKVDEVLPNKNKSTLLCVDCSWLKEEGQRSIIDRNDLDEIVDVEYSAMKVVNFSDEIVFTKWVNMVDEDGDVHHCKIESFATLSDNIYRPIEEEVDWVVYIEL
jgi:hypothetical protein